MEKRFFHSIFVVVFCTSTVLADVWESPKAITAYSENKEYMLVVYPTEYPKNYFTAKYQRQRKRGMVVDAVKPCRAILYRVSSSDTLEIWNRPLVNAQSPVQAFVANDGKSVITIDDWHQKGSIHTFVVYDESGELNREFELKEISPFPLEEYYRSISSIHWGGSAKYLDNNRVEILFVNKDGIEAKKIYNVKDRGFD
jgi:hypothetical protein